MLRSLLDVVQAVLMQERKAESLISIRLILQNEMLCAEDELEIESSIEPGSRYNSSCLDCDD